MEKTKLELHNAGFQKVERISAIVGKILDLSKEPLSLRSRYDMCHPKDSHFALTTKGAVGCAKTHRHVWQHMVDHNISASLICEDDPTFGSKGDFREKSEILIQKMKECDLLDSGVLLLHSFNNIGAPSGYEKTDIEGLSRVISPVGSLACYRMTLSAAKILLKHFEPLEMQVDLYMTTLASAPNALSGGEQFRVWACQPTLVNVPLEAVFSGDIQTVDIKPMLPTNNYFYLFVLVLILVLFILTIVFFAKWRGALKRADVRKNNIISLH